MSGPFEPEELRRANRNLALLFGVPLFLLALILVPWFVHHWVQREGAMDIQNVATLPQRISVCGRSWLRGPDVVTTTLNAERARGVVEPIVVDMGPFTPCPAGPCTRTAADVPCDTVVYVRVGAADYVAFGLVGGP